MSGCVLFEDYFDYLQEYFLRNTASTAACLDDLHAAATRVIQCIEEEDKLASTIAGYGGPITIPAGHHALSKRIKDQAYHAINPDSPRRPPTVPAACLMCIAEEAKFMSEVLARSVAFDRGMHG